MEEVRSNLPGREFALRHASANGVQRVQESIQLLVQRQSAPISAGEQQCRYQRGILLRTTWRLGSVRWSGRHACSLVLPQVWTFANRDLDSIELIPQIFETTSANVLTSPSPDRYGGDIHFDLEENWTSKSYSGTNLLQVATHEIGHALGLEHSTNRKALMAPFYQRYKRNLKLHQDDIKAIQVRINEI